MKPRPHSTGQILATAARHEQDDDDRDDRDRDRAGDPDQPLALLGRADIDRLRLHTG